METFLHCCRSVTRIPARRKGPPLGLIAYFQLSRWRCPPGCLVSTFVLRGRCGRHGQRKFCMLIKDTLWKKAVAFIAAGIIGGFLVAGLLAPAAALGSTLSGASIDFFDQLPSDLDLQPPARRSQVLAQDGSHIATFYSQNRTPVELEQMSAFIRDGIGAIEDARFYDHGGI